MGIIDLKIDVTRPTWLPRHRRMISLKTSTNNPTDYHNEPSTSASSSSLSQPTETTIFNNTASSNHDERKNRMDIDLLLAAKSRDVDTLIDALERVCTVKNIPLSEIVGQVSLAGNTLLHVCVIYGNQESAAYIAYHFPTLLMSQNSHGDTAMHLAARAGDGEMVETLVDTIYSTIPNTSYHEGEIPFHEQARDRYRLLSSRNMEGNVPLHESLIQGHSVEIAKNLFSYYDLKVLHFVNEKGESPLYLAAMMGEAKLVEEILYWDKNENADGRLKGKSAIHAAILKRNQRILEILLDREPRFILLRDEKGRTPVHLAASLGCLEEAKYLLGIKTDSVFERDDAGFLPIHLASMKGHISLVQLLLQYWPEPCELLSSNGQNILHVAILKRGHDMINYILGTKEFEKLINMKDKDGNTPLHVATMSWDPRIVSTLTWDKRVDLNLENSEDKTALDCAEYHMERTPSVRMRLTWAALKSGGVPRAYLKSIPENKLLQHSSQSDPSGIESYKDRVNTLLLVATLVATITFAAGFTMPGGYNNSAPDQGMATMLNSRWFQLFVFSDTIAMYSSIIVSVSLIWAQLGDLNLVLTAFRLAIPLLGVSLSMMSLSFIAGVYLVVSKLRWLAIAVLVIGFVLLGILVILFFFLCFPISSNHHVLRYITYYPFCLLIFVTKKYN